MNKHLTFLPSPGAEDSAPKFKGPVYCWQLCCEAFPFHTLICANLTKSFNRRGDFTGKVWFFSDYRIRKMSFIGSVTSSLEKISSQYQDSAKTGRELPGLALTCLPGCWVCGVGSHGCHLTTGPGKGKVRLVTGCQRLAINPCQCWMPTAMRSSSKVPHSWKWGTWEGST